MSATGEKNEYLFKVLVIGDVGTGKTSIIKRYVHDVFSDYYRATIGVDFAMKILNWNDDTIIRLQLWDIAGQERFGNMTRVYYREASAAILVFDITRSVTFDGINKWKHDLDSKVGLASGRPIPAVLLANKCDVDDKEKSVKSQAIEEYCSNNSYIGWFETSAKENTGINDAISKLVTHILANKAEYELPVVEKDMDIQRLSVTSTEKRARRFKCCPS